MARPASDIIADIDGFSPSNGNWLGLDALLQELFLSESASAGIDAMLRVFESFPEEHGNGVFWTIVHGLESQPGYEKRLVESVRRVPTYFAWIPVNRLLNAECKEVEGVRLVSLLEQVANSETTSPAIRQAARQFLGRFKP
jgi:hypothetical protein